MSWLSGYTTKPSTSSASSEEIREAKRKKLEADRLLRTQQREKSRQQIKAAQEAREQAHQALQDLLAIAPDILEGDFSSGEVVSEDILEDETMDFEKENGTDGDKALDKLSGLNIPFNKSDIEFWFSNVEGRLELIGVKSQWLKRMALLQLLPAEVQEEVKSLFKLQKSQAGTEIYFKIKKELLDLFGPKAEDAYDRAANRVLTGKPSQLGKLLIDDLCKADTKLSGCCCDRIVWGMFRKQLPIVVRNHISDLPFNKDTYKSVFAKADQVFDSNRGPDPQVASTSVSVTSATEVAAVQKSQKKNKKQNKGQKDKGGQSDKNDSTTAAAAPKPKINEDKLCKIHAKWKENATFCAAPWGCRMKSVYKAPQ